VIYDYYDELWLYWESVVRNKRLSVGGFSVEWLVRRDCAFWNLYLCVPKNFSVDTDTCKNTFQ